MVPMFDYNMLFVKKNEFWPGSKRFLMKPLRGVIKIIIIRNNSEAAIDAIGSSEHKTS